MQYRLSRSILLQISLALLLFFLSTSGVDLLTVSFCIARNTVIDETQTDTISRQRLRLAPRPSLLAKSRLSLISLHPISIPIRLYSTSNRPFSSSSRCALLLTSPSFSLFRFAHCRFVLSFSLILSVLQLHVVHYRSLLSLSAVATRRRRTSKE